MAVFLWVIRRLGSAPQHRKRPRHRYVAESKRLLGIQDFPHVTRALAVFVARLAVVKGFGIPQRSLFDSGSRRYDGG